MINLGATLVSRLAVLIAILFTLAACGGGGGGGSFYDEDDNPDNPPAEATYTVAVTLFDSTGQATTSLAQSATGTVEIVVTNNANSGQPVSNASITALVTSGTLSPTSGITDANGKLTLNITASATVGTATIEAATNINSVTYTGTLNFQVVEFVPYLLELTLLGPDGQPASSLTKDTQGTLEAKITSADSSGAPVPGVVVSATTTFGSLTPITPLTDSDGIARFTVVAGSTAGAGTISATAQIDNNTLNSELNFQVTDTNVNSKAYFLELTLLDSTDTSTNTLAKDKAGTLVVKVTSGSVGGDPEPNVVILATTDLGTLGSSRSLTNSNGIATFAVAAGSLVSAGTISVTPQIAGTSLSGTLNFQVTDGIVGIVPYFVELTLLGPDGQPTNSLAKNTEGRLLAKVTSGSETGPPVENQLVSAITTVGSLDTGTAMTNSNGIASFKVVAGSTVTAGSVTASTQSAGNTYIDVLNYQVVEELYFLTLTLLDAEDQPTTSLTERTEGSVQILVTKGSESGPPVNKAIVTVESSLGALDPNNGLTDNNGLVTLGFSGGATIGAGTMTASTAINGDTFTNSLNFEITRRIRKLGYFENNVFIENEIMVIPGAGSTLSAGADALLSVVVLDENDERVTEQEEVIFSSGCVAAGQSTLSPANPVTVYAQAVTTYSTVSCSGVDNITARIAGLDPRAFGTLDVAAPQTDAIHFISAVPEVISLRGTGGASRSETSNLVFRVLDQSGRPLPAVRVNFSLDPESTSVGGLELSNDYGISNADGDVFVTVQAGDVATPIVVVVATVGEGIDMVYAPSSALSVSTGLPEQNSISLSVEQFIIPNAANENNVTTTLTVNMDDRFNNKVPEGSTAGFRTEYGSIEPSCNTGPLGTATAGLCTVIWSSTAPKFPKMGSENIRTIYNTDCPDYVYPDLRSGPMPCPRDLGFTRGMRSNILVFAIGEETFNDRNGNGYMDEAEKDLFVNLGEAFEDHNEDGQYTPGLPECIDKEFDDPNLSAQCKAGFDEEFIDFNGNGKYDSEGPSPLYNGLKCPIEGNGLWCSRTLLNVWDDLVVTLSHDPSFTIVMVRDENPNDSDLPVVVTGTITNKSQRVYVSDQYNNAPPAGSTIAFSVIDNCEIVGLTEFTVPSIYNQGAYGVSVKTRPRDEDPVPPEVAETGTLIVTLSLAEGSNVVESYDCDVKN